MDKDKKTAVVAQFQRQAKDTGSTEVQVALLTHRISQITEHLRGHEKDQISRRGLFTLVGQRRRLLGYLHKSDVEKYRSVVQQLGLRK